MAREYADPENPSDRGVVETGDFGLFPPLGLLYVLSALKINAPEHESFFLDCVAEKVGHGQLGARISAIRPDVVGITSFTMSLYDVCLAARTIRDVYPGVHLCLGGHHPMAFPFEAAGLPEFDSIVVGEGERVFPNLVNALSQGEDIAAITGVYTRESIHHCRENLLQTDPRFLTHLQLQPAYIDDIDTLEFPDRSAIRHIPYRSVIGASTRFTTMISSRGCPYGCSYCDVPYKRHRQRSVQSVADEIGECLDLGYEEIHFYDDLFNITPERVIEFCDEVDRRGYRFCWDFRGRVNGVTRESLERAKFSGCRMISFGVETGSDEGLRLLGKQTTTDEVRRVFKWCREIGILTVADFMIGLPFERSADDVRRNVDFLLSLDPDYSQFAILSLFPHTELFEEATRKGLIDPGRWTEHARSPLFNFHVDHWEEFLSIAEILQLQGEMYRRFYLRPAYVWRSIISTRTWHEFRSKLEGALKLLAS